MWRKSWYLRPYYWSKFSPQKIFPWNQIFPFLPYYLFLANPLHGWWPLGSLGLVGTNDLRASCLDHWFIFFGNYEIYWDVWLHFSVIYQVIQSDLFGMVKWPPTRGSKGHIESPGTWFLILMFYFSTWDFFRIGWRLWRSEHLNFRYTPPKHDNLQRILLFHRSVEIFRLKTWVLYQDVVWEYFWRCCLVSGRQAWRVSMMWRCRETGGKLGDRSHVSVRKWNACGEM